MHMRRRRRKQNTDTFDGAPTGRTTVWGNTVATGEAYTGVGPLNTTTLTVFGRVPINQNAKADAYTDMVVATITY